MFTNLSTRMDNLNGSATREILKLTQDPTIISFAGGMPASDCFPTEQIAQITQDLLRGNRVTSLLQYGTTDGLKSVKESMCGYLQTFGIQNMKPENVMMISGGQQGLDLACKVFLNKGDVCLVENPTYLAMLQILNSYEAKAIGVDANDDGLIIEDLEAKIKKYNPKMLYVVPTFSNPTGKTYTIENRKRISEITSKYGVMLIEDDPYSQLRFEGSEVPSIMALSNNAPNSVFISSFSKIISPGLRQAVICGSKEVIRKFEICKQGVDVHSPNLNQAIVEEFVRRDLIRPHLDIVRPKYKVKKDAMIDAINKYMPEEYKYYKAEGGLFIWGEMPKYINTRECFQRSIDRKVAYIYGDVFYADGSGLNTLRLNFSNATLPNIDKGIKSLGELMKQLIMENK